MNRPTDKPTAAKPEDAAPAAPPAEPAPAAPAARKGGTAARSDADYAEDQAAQRRASTRFDSSRFRRKQDTAAAP
jgi:hypothetical protein